MVLSLSLFFFLSLPVLPVSCLPCLISCPVPSRHPDFCLCTSSSSQNPLQPFHTSFLLVTTISLRAFLPSSSSPSLLLLAVSSHPSLQRPSTAAARRLTFSPQHQQRHRDGPHQLLQRGGHPQHVPRGPAAGRPGPAELRLPRRARLPVAVARQQPGPEDTRRHGDFQQVHVEVCTQVSSPGNTQKRGQGD